MSKPRIIAQRYALVEKIGSGGMGEVWRAQHTSLNSFFAVKLLSSASGAPEAARGRFLKEAQITAQLKSRNAVQVYDFGITDEGVPYLVMEYISGETLDALVDRGLVPADRAVRILRDCARALDRAHQHGIVHRDFKPANVILSRDEDGQEIAKVLDFGVAKLVGDLEPIDRHDPSLEDATVTSFTRTGTLAGTPAYMAPEQIDPGHDIGPSTDLWALGVVAYEMVTGRMPFETDDMATLFRLIRDALFLPPSEANPALPPAVDGWFKRACARRAEARFATAGEAVRALAEALGADEALAQPSMRAPQRSLVETLAEQVPVPRHSESYSRFSLDLEDSGGSLELALETAPPASPRGGHASLGVAPSGPPASPHGGHAPLGVAPSGPPASPHGGHAPLGIAPSGPPASPRGGHGAHDWVGPSSSRGTAAPPPGPSRPVGPPPPPRLRAPSLASLEDSGMPGHAPASAPSTAPPPRAHAPSVSSLDGAALFAVEGLATLDAPTARPIADDPIRAPVEALLSGTIAPPRAPSPGASSLPPPAVEPSHQITPRASSLAPPSSIATGTPLAPYAPAGPGAPLAGTIPPPDSTALVARVAPSSRAPTPRVAEATSRRGWLLAVVFGVIMLAAFVAGVIVALRQSSDEPTPHHAR